MCSNLQCKAQNTIAKYTKQVITYYPNGAVKYIENFLLDSCNLLKDTNSEVEKIKSNGCYYGFFKEYYQNGILKTLGQYDCVISNKNTLLFSQEQEFCECNNLVDFYNGYYCFKTGIWHNFDSLGNLISDTKFICDHEIFTKKYLLKKDTLFANKDSILFKIKSYDDTDSYVIKRKNTNAILLLEFPTASMSDYHWLVFKESLPMLLHPEKLSLEYYKKAFKVFSYSDAGSSKDIYVNLSKFKNGIYYIYSYYKTKWYETEINIQNE